VVIYQYWHKGINYWICLFVLSCPWRPISEKKKGCISFITSHLSVCMYPLGFHWMEFHEINEDLYSNIKKIQVCFMLDQNIMHFTWRPKYSLLCWQWHTAQQHKQYLTVVLPWQHSFLSLHYNRYWSTMALLIRARRTTKIRMHHNVISCIYVLYCLQLMIHSL
jgi:hypothetical protein